MWKSHKGNSKVIGSMEHGSFEEKMTSLAPTANCCDIESSEFKKIFSYFIRYLTLSLHLP